MKGRAFLDDDRGQDLVEYALLAVFVALASAATLVVLRTSMTTAVERWNESTAACWDMPEPGTPGGC